MSDTKTPEQLAAEANAAVEAAKAAKAKAEADAKAAKEAAKAQQKAAREAQKKAEADAKEAAKAKAEAERKEKAEAKAKAEAERQAAKEAKAASMPEQNGVKRPAPGGKCAAAWDLMDAMSKEVGGPVAIGDLMPRAKAAGMNENMVRGNYAVWRKFHNVTGRVLSTVKQEATAKRAAEKLAKAQEAARKAQEAAAKAEALAAQLRGNTAGSTQPTA